MSKLEQNKSAQKIKKTLKKLGVSMNIRVSQEVDSETIAIYVSNGKWEDTEDGFIIVLDEAGDIERLCHEEYTTIIDNPTEFEIAEFILKQGSRT